jgi:hypothetical protein
VGHIDGVEASRTGVPIWLTLTGMELARPAKYRPPDGPDWSEQVVADVWNAVARAFRQDLPAVNRLPAQPSSIETIGEAFAQVSQMSDHTFGAKRLALPSSDDPIA